MVLVSNSTGSYPTFSIEILFRSGLLNHRLRTGWIYHKVKSTQHWNINNKVTDTPDLGVLSCVSVIYITVTTLF